MTVVQGRHLSFSECANWDAILPSILRAILKPEDQWSCKRHLISPTVSTKTSKIGQGQPRVIIYINFVQLESPMLHTKFQDHRTSGSGEEDF